MKIKNILLAATLTVTNLSICAIPASAETYASPAELIVAAATDAVAGVSDTAYTSELTALLDNITVTDNMVFYKNRPIGLWYDDSPEAIYTDINRTNTMLLNTGDDTWEISPAFLSLIMEDIDIDLIETDLSNDVNWNNLVGTYGITLGDTHFTFSQFPYVSIVEENDTAINNGSCFDLKKYNCDITNLTENVSSLGFIAYIIDNNGDLYLHNQATSIFKDFNGAQVEGAFYEIGGTSGRLYWGMKSDTSGYAVKGYGNYKYPKLIIRELSDGTAVVVPVLTDENGASDEYLKGFINNSVTYDNKGKFLKMGDPTVTYSGDFSDVRAGFIIYDACENLIDSTALSNMLTKNARSTKFYDLDVTDTVVINPNGWTVYGLNNSYTSSQALSAAGSTADVPVYVDADAMSFRVIVPTSLPVYIDTEGVTYVADNAAIENQSNASVKLVDIDIQPTVDSGWTMVNTKPSAVRDANEFSLETSLTKDAVITRGAIFPFTYNAALSPITNGIQKLDLASVLITIDWAD